MSALAAIRRWRPAPRVSDQSDRGLHWIASIRAFGVVWLASEIGIPYELIPVSFGVADAQCKQPWYLQLNPNGKVPTIDDDGFIVWEAAAINIYLAEKYSSAFYPPIAIVLP